VAHCDPSKEELLRQIRYPQASELNHGAFRVYKTAAPFVENSVDEKLIAELVPEEDRAMINLLKPASFAAVPMTARGRVIGSITMVHTQAGLVYGEAELWLAGELAHRTALALDNVELYSAANQAREEAEAANRSKDRFLAMLSHELRTPLTPVIAHLVKMASDETVPESLRHPLEVIRRNVELEARLIDDLLDLTRVGSGKIHLETKVVDAHDLLRNALEICQPDFEAKNLEVHLDLSASRSHVQADPARLQQVFWNIIKNAVKFTWKGSITVATSTEDGSRLAIEIRDTGIGMDRALLARAFHAFEQAERGKQGGLGLGLAITKALVDLHDGAIEMASPGDGLGTAVTVRLPSTDPVPDKELEEGSALEEKTRSLRILLVEDHPDTNESLALLLELRGHSVTSALNVKSALGIASLQDFDLLLSDLGLPDGNAGEVMKVVADRNGAVGVALSGYGMDKDFEMSRGYGFSHHLVKPVEIARLDQILRCYSKALPDVG
jgi:two-component system CheB/CheR fusion protein